MRQVQIVQPDTIVTLGRVATESMLEEFGLPHKDTKLGDVHGKPLDVHTSYGETTLLPMYHPATSFYNRDLQDTMRADFDELKRLI